MSTELHIPCESQLLQYWEEDGDFRTAFCRWAEELTTGYDRARDRGHLSPNTEEFDSEAVADACKQHVSTRYPELRRQLNILHKPGELTYAQLAKRAALPLDDVIVSYFSGNSLHLKERILDCEAWLLANPAKFESYAAQARQFRLQPETVRFIADHHEMSPPSMTRKVKYRSRISAEIRLEGKGLLAEGYGPAETLRILQSRHPEDQGLQTLTRQAVNSWGKFGTRKCAA